MSLCLQFFRDLTQCPNFITWHNPTRQFHDLSGDDEILIGVIVKQNKGPDYDWLRHPNGYYIRETRFSILLMLAPEHVREKLFLGENG